MRRREKGILHWDGVAEMVFSIHRLDLGGGVFASLTIRISRLLIVSCVPFPMAVLLDFAHLLQFSSRFMFRFASLFPLSPF